jgi:tetratricopeptide (TPR) repeat protein
MNLNVARSLLEQGRDGEALEAIRNAETCFLTLGWEIEAARAEINKGIIQAEKGNISDARAAFRHAVEILEEAGRGADAGAALTELARLDRLEGKHVEAEALLEKAWTMIPEGEMFDRATALRERGLCRVDQGDERGEGFLLEAIDLFRQAGSSLEVGRTYRELGDARRRHGANDSSAEAYRAGLEAIEAAWLNDKPGL